MKKTMTATQFLARLQETPRNWHVSEGRIRCESGLCPIEAVAGTGRYTAINLGAPELGLSDFLVDRIINGADSSDLSSWRKRLLKACSLGK